MTNKEAIMKLNDEIPSTKQMAIDLCCMAALTFSIIFFFGAL